MKPTVKYLLLIMLTWPAALCQGQNNSLFLRAEQKYRAGSIRGKNMDMSTGSPAGSGPVQVSATDSRESANKIVLDKNITPIMEAHWFAVEEPAPKDFRVHDLVTIIVNEVSKHTVKAESEAQREHSIDFALEEWIRLTDGNLRPDKQSRGDPKIKGSVEREFQGESDIQREDTLMARIQAKVIDVMPNGNLILEATHTVVVDDEVTRITLTGTCRSKDVGIDNSIISSKIADLEIQKKHTGMARDATKRSVLMEILDFLNPF
ncbi:MAG: flagellar basal body L-ring protein FlgH [Sedimentisphaerales bacterium]|nr:flagellar basal body L-ring protein FlgH [Sedimentisphaerales bacterium]